MTGLIGGLFATGYLVYKDRTADLDFRRNAVARVKQMDRMKDDLLDFAMFIEQQQRLVHEYDAKLERLLSEHSRYSGLLEVEKSEVQLLMAYYEERMDKAENRTLLIGALIGIATSLIASFIFSIITKRMKL